MAYEGVKPTCIYIYIEREREREHMISVVASKLASDVSHIKSGYLEQGAFCCKCFSSKIPECLRISVSTLNMQYQVEKHQAD